jgi:hypothetical protein
MPISSPNLDDRTFADLVQEAQEIIRLRCPDWSDLTPSDPGIVLLELFAHLTDVMLYRLNRLPEKAYVEFLRLIGVRLQPPGAAFTTLEFTTERPTPLSIVIPLGTRVTASVFLPGTEPPVFVTAASATIEPAGTSVQVPAYQCELVEAELAGTGPGQPGQFVSAARPPVVAPTGDPRDLVVGVQAEPHELDEFATTITFGGRFYRVWTEVESFALTQPDDCAYVADRAEGLVTFAPAARLLDSRNGELAESPAALAALPQVGREIRLWYRRGGGQQGNVPAQALTVLKDPVAGVAVTNPEAASGGRAAETLENALVRGPQELHALNRVVTARDYEMAAVRVGGVARARAVARASLWTFAPPGQVEVALVPEVPPEEAPGGRISASGLRARQTSEALGQVDAILAERRPLGTQCRVGWGRTKTVTVHARLHVRRDEDADLVRERVVRRLYGTISPLPNDANTAGWAFGQPLRVSDVYYAAQREPGVRYVDMVRLELADAPDRAVTSVAADRSQPHLWYAGSESTVFTSLNDGAGWEAAGSFPGERVSAIRPQPELAGWLAVATRLDRGGSRVRVSPDCGESWRQVAEVADSPVRDLAWLGRDTQRLLLIATDNGLYELGMQEDATPVPVLVDPARPARPLYAVAVTTVRGAAYVAVAAQAQAGVFISAAGGRSGSYRPIGLANDDVRVLAVQREGPRAFLWAGLMVEYATDPGGACRSWEIGDEDPPDGWVAHGAGWNAGSCTGIAFAGSAVLASSHHGGVLWLGSRDAGARWRTPGVDSGLPLRDAGRFDRLATVASAPDGGVVIAGGGRGVVVTRDRGTSYTVCRRILTTEDVTVPPDWLLCSGDHQIDVVRY